MKTARSLALAGLLLAAAAGQQALAQFADAARPAVKDAAKPEEAKKPDEPQITVKGAKDEEATKARLRADALLARCVIKPVMTDEEIQLCISAYKQTR